MGSDGIRWDKMKSDGIGTFARCNVQSSLVGRCGAVDVGAHRGGTDAANIAEPRR